MRAQVQKIFMQCGSNKQVMMFSATLSQKTKDICRMYMKDPKELFVDDDSKLTLHGLKQYYVKLEEA
jgi:ATP-dependent RNA helicase UAP56/SUB2